MGRNLQFTYALRHVIHTVRDGRDKIRTRRPSVSSSGNSFVNAASMLRRVLLLISCWRLAVATMTSLTFRLMTSSDGAAVCAVETPSSVLPMASPELRLQCAVACLLSPGRPCLMFQFKSDSRQCELFIVTPANFAVVPHCSASHVQPSK